MRPLSPSSEHHGDFKDTLKPLPGVTMESKLEERHQAVAATNDRMGFYKLVADVFCVAIPIALLAFIVVLYDARGKPVNPSTLSAWNNAIAVLATIFPLIFAAIIGRLTYQAARWKLESGTTMKPLEQLLGSKSVGSTMFTQFRLGTGSVNALGALLILTWAFSPLGSQSILRILGSTLQEREAKSLVTWGDNLRQRLFADFNIVTASVEETAQAENLYRNLFFSATLTTSEAVKKEPMDQWGNVKIPYLSRDQSSSTSSDWADIQTDQGIERYSSLAGIPIVNVPFGNTTLFIESSHLELDCETVELEEGTRASRGGSETSSFDLDITWDWPGPMDYRNDSRPENGTWQGTLPRPMVALCDVEDRPSWVMAVNNSVDPFWWNTTVEAARQASDNPPEEDRNPNNAVWNGPEHLPADDGIEMGPTGLYFQATWGKGARAPPDSLHAMCGARQRYVESKVTCERRDENSWTRNCTVIAQRPSQKAHPSELVSRLNFPNIWFRIAGELPRVGGYSGNTQGSWTRADYVIQYLNDPVLSSIKLSTASGGMFVDVDRETFGRRLGQVLNTYMLLDDLLLAAPGASSGDNAEELAQNITEEVQTVTLEEVYEVSGLWVAIGVAACVVLFLGGTMSVVLRHLATGPDILGYASTVIRDSKYIDLPPVMGGMGGLEVSKRMGDQRVRFGVTDLVQENQVLVGVAPAHRTRGLGEKDKSSSSDDRLC